MPRRKKDGSRAAAPDKRKLTEGYLQRGKPNKDRAFCTCSPTPASWSSSWLIG